MQRLKPFLDEINHLGHPEGQPREDRRYIAGTIPGVNELIGCKDTRSFFRIKIIGLEFHVWGKEDLQELIEHIGRKGTFWISDRQTVTGYFWNDDDQKKLEV